jgi:hypothetical protein
MPELFVFDSSSSKGISAELMPELFNSLSSKGISLIQENLNIKYIY